MFFLHRYENVHEYVLCNHRAAPIRLSAVWMVNKIKIKDLAKLVMLGWAFMVNKGSPRNFGEPLAAYTLRFRLRLNLLNVSHLDLKKKRTRTQTSHDSWLRLRFLDILKSFFSFDRLQRPKSMEMGRRSLIYAGTSVTRPSHEILYTFEPDETSCLSSEDKFWYLRFYRSHAGAIKLRRHNLPHKQNWERKTRNSLSWALVINLWQYTSCACAWW